MLNTLYLEDESESSGELFIAGKFVESTVAKVGTGF